MPSGARQTSSSSGRPFSSLAAKSVQTESVLLSNMSRSPQRGRQKRMVSRGEWIGDRHAAVGIRQKIDIERDSHALIVAFVARPRSEIECWLLVQMIQQRVPGGILPRFFLAGSNPTTCRHDLSDGFAAADHGVSFAALHVRENAVRAAGEVFGRDRLVHDGNPYSFRPFFAMWRPIPSLPDRVLLPRSERGRSGSSRKQNSI